MKWWVAVGGFLLALALGILGQSGRRQRAAEMQRDELLVSGITGNEKKAEKANKKASKAKASAKLAAEETQKRLEANSANTDMDDLLSAFESERVRQR